jgi:hypothetical protein
MFSKGQSSAQNSPKKLMSNLNQTDIHNKRLLGFSDGNKTASYGSLLLFYFLLGVSL